MKTLPSLLLLIPLATGLTACDDFSPAALQQQGQGELRWTLDRQSYTKAPEELPDTNDFLLSVTDANGEVLYEGSYGDSPESLLLSPGNYTVSIVSIPFTSPAFARPQYGDTQVAVIRSGESVTVRLHCTLRNAGIRLNIAPDFLTSFPDGILYVKQDDVKLKYQYNERRIAYLKPGEMSLLLYNYGEFETLFTRELSAREILTMNISAPSGNGTGSGSISVQTDTTKNWNSGSYTIGGDNSGDTSSPSGNADGAIPVGEASAHIGEEVWLHGYIVGGDLTSAGKNVKTSGITKATHLALADRSSVTAKASCVAVELPKGPVRDALNLVNHRDLVGTRVYVRGTLVEAYFGTVGLKGTNDFILK